MNQAHARLGHMNENKTRKTAKALGWILKPGNFETCIGCAEGKSKQKNVPKETEHVKATKDEPRVFLDISTVRDPEGDTLSKPNWRKMVDERTGIKFSEFFARKINMVEPTCEKLYI